MKARYPNGDPLKIKDGYDNGCRSVAWWDISGVKQFPTNIKMVSKSGANISQGSVFPPNAPTRTVVIADRDAPREGETTGDNPSYYNTRFNETYNHPFWATTSPSAIQLSTTLAARSTGWKAAQGAVVRMLHPAGWGGWAFEVASVENGLMKFSKGGNQEARGNKGCGAMYVEGIEEELDSVSAVAAGVVHVDNLVCTRLPCAHCPVRTLWSKPRLLTTSCPLSLFAAGRVVSFEEWSAQPDPSSVQSPQPRTLLITLDF